MQVGEIATLREHLERFRAVMLQYKGQISLYLHMGEIEAPFFAFVLPPGIRPDKRPFAPPST
jgi:hypothetical protein